MASLGTCELCGRGDVELTRHHLIPRTRHSNRRNQRLFEREDVRTRLAMLCRPCHGFIHKTLSEKEMEQRFNTLELLREHPGIARFITWVRTKPAGLRVRSRAPAG